MSLEHLFFGVVILWVFSEVYYTQKFASKKEDEKGKDKNSLKYLWMVIVLSISIGVTSSFSTKFFISEHFEIQYVGIALILLGTIFRYLFIRSLGKFFTVDVTIRKEHALKTDGIYSVLRHPTYFASLFTFLGLGLYLNNWLSLFLIFVPVFLVFLYRINIEEKALNLEFGEQYADYSKRTKKLIPFIF